MKKTVWSVVLISCILFAVLLAGCNTINGVGKDIKAGGNAIEKSSGK